MADEFRDEHGGRNPYIAALRAARQWHPPEGGGQRLTPTEQFEDAINCIIDERVAAAKAEWVKSLRVVKCGCDVVDGIDVTTLSYTMKPNPDCLSCGGSGYVIKEKRG